MTREERSCVGYVIAGIIVIAVIITALTYIQPDMIRWRNNLRMRNQVAHDETDYTTLRRVEDTARAMIASYHADRLTWEQYRDSENEEQRGWASNARMRANRTASNFNNFMRENTFVWSFGIPDDIDEELPFIE